MTNEELANAVDELDTRLERLRVLMEQYFQGIEKIPPFIVQKDVDRRIWVLRREKIRNTGTRFRFQQIIQRYNTFGSYWQRILREIENGTYKRDVMRAKKRFGIDANKPNLRTVEEPKVVEEAPPESEAPRSVDLDIEDDDDLSDLGDLGPLPVGNKAPARPPPKPPVAAAPLPHLPTVSAAPPKAASATPPAVAPKPLTTKPPLHRPPPSPAVPGILASKVENDDDLDNMLDAALGTAPVKPKPAPVVAAKPEPERHVNRPGVNPFARPAPAAAAPKPANAEDFRKVYSQYVETRRRNGESTAGLTYETLARSLKETTEKLKTKSGGKAIDFEVATKDGKTILKPVVR